MSSVLIISFMSFFPLVFQRKSFQIPGRSFDLFLMVIMFAYLPMAKQDQEKPILWLDVLQFLLNYFKTC